jgi:hypothetical protein
MTSRSFNKLTVILWINLFCSVAFFLIFALLIKDTQVNLGDWNDLIKNTTDIERLRNIAENVASFNQITVGTSIGLCHIAIGAFIIITVGAIIGLSQVRKMKKQMAQPPNAAQEPN